MPGLTLGLSLTEINAISKGGLVITWSPFLTSLSANLITSDLDTFKVKD